jgi:selenocysteine-specific elongation factor
MTTDLILGTAGHIDHGKTSLIRALTGVDTDRLPEEKKRGITIDLGFAELEIGDFRFGIVDVPGHERFVRNMLAGATGMDVAMLVVAADDSIKPQTREHLDILRLLDLRSGVIAITKCDLSESDWIDLVEDEIRELVTGTFLERAPIVRTSATTGLGLDEVREHLAIAAGQSLETRPRASEEAPFRMAIDRTFTIAGHGTVVTGSVSSGHCTVGDDLIIEPGAVKVRVRGLQNHDRSVDSLHRGQRAAINLAGIHHEQIGRGQELATPGHLKPSRLLTVRIQMVAGTSRPLKNRSRLRLHVGTADLAATVVLLDADSLRAGEEGCAQLFLAQPTVTTWNQPFVLRSPSPVVTIGGGQVLVPDAEKIRKPDATVLRWIRQLRSTDPVQRASAAIYFAGLREWHPRDLARTAGIDTTDAVYESLRKQGLVAELPISPTRTLLVHPVVLEELCVRIEAVLAALHQNHPLRTAIEDSQIKKAFSYLDEIVLREALKLMRQEGRIAFSPQGVTLEGHGPKLTQNERKLLSQLIDQYHDAGLQTPTVKQAQQSATKNQSSVPHLIELAVASGELVQVAPDFYLHQEVDRELREKLVGHLSQGKGLTLSEIREILNTSRKYAVPYCEYLDRIGFTRREDDLRVLVKQDA